MGVGQAVVRRTSLRLCLTTRLPGLTAVHLAPPVGELSAKLTERGAQLCLTTRSPGLTAVHLAPPVGELSSEARLRGGFAQRSQRNQRFQRFYGTPRNPRFQRNQRNHDFTVPPGKHDFNEINEITISRYPPKTTKATKSRFHGTPRKARFQRNQRNHDFTAPQRNHESNETHENNEMPLLRAFRFFRCVWRNRDFVATVGARQKARRVVYW